ncbi:hypothetical protein [Clostridium beijerinckii]|uniref:Uncharacterized protein n=1 Tax=Clostridium beijerinckii TaxID=1520 RepID=A0A1S9NBE9_CLOBE|nr:hypothetical protein [Clostridium beijerinckii]MBC2455724.1 hypothetical protein [Clostridium beijerinckii]MBC2473201.1 hypothetical protein [Clostridium beijerinckii]NOV62290.1 hypothetical protein [Clostridium beijerinckii]NOV68213.1 hypothetical protein [Clostridium beijerinckii]NOW30342.1 hypothetical protein [Clostridium beijerinckii]
MSKEKKVSHTSDVRDGSKKDFTNSYLPKMRTNYHPSRDDVESATGVDFPVNMPNPAVDPIVVNNIASQEFDYTQDMLSPDNYEIDGDD